MQKGHRPLAISFRASLSAYRTLLFHLGRGHFALGLESFCHQLVFYVDYAENLEAAQNILEVCPHCLLQVTLQVRWGGGGSTLCPAFPSPPPSQFVLAPICSWQPRTSLVFFSQDLGLETRLGICSQNLLVSQPDLLLPFTGVPLQKLVRKNKAFSRFKKLQESRPELKGCRLEELLPLPLQRLHQ